MRNRQTRALSEPERSVYHASSDEGDDWRVSRQTADGEHAAITG